jgi:TrmH family RNA methyltransferase
LNVSRLSQAERKKIASLRQKKFREAEGVCMVEGRRAVESAVAAGASIRQIIVTDDLVADPSVTVLFETARTVAVAPPKDFARMTDVTTSQGIVAIADIARSSLDEIKIMKRIVVLDGIQDPGNVGSIIRSAAWFGVGGVVCGPGVADCYGPKVMRSSMGSVWDLKLVRSGSLAQSLQTLLSSGFAIYSADLEGESVEKWEARLPSTLVLGSEAHGVSSELAPLLMGRVRIPSAGRPRATESLNVAVAAGILLSRWMQTG